MKKPRCNYSAKPKALVALEAIRGEQNDREIAANRKVHHNQSLEFSCSSMYLEARFYGFRELAEQLRRGDRDLGWRDMRTLMHRMRIEAIYRKRRTDILARGTAELPSDRAAQLDVALPPDGARFSVPGSDLRCGEPQSARLAALQHADDVPLPRVARGSDAQIRQARDLQHRPASAIHRRELDHDTYRRWDRHPHGGQRSLENVFSGGCGAA